MKKYFFFITAAFLLSSCVAKRYLVQSQNETAGLRDDSTQLANSNADLQSKLNSLNEQNATLNKQIAGLQKNIDDLNGKIANLNSQNSQLGQQTAEQQSKISQSQKQLQQLQDLLNQQKRASQELKDKMTEALKGFNSNELSVYQKDGKVYVSLSEQLLFPSGSAVVNPKGVEALSKLAAVLNLNSDVAVDIEGHTDSIPIRGRYQDNWELSTARANAIVRILVNNYKVDPTRVISSGHSYYDPVAPNSTPEGRAKNRRTDIILSPNLEEMYKLLGS